MKCNSTLTLRDLGERRIVQELIIPRFPALADHIVAIGDDAVVLPPVPGDQAIVLTTDPCPTPVVCLIEQPDMFHYGWMTMLINVSDLAAMGARPTGLLVSTVMPETMLCRDYMRFLDGLEEASKIWECPVLGGNIKDGSTFTATGTAIGMVKPEHAMRRNNAKPGDLVCVIGEMGLFFAAIISHLYKIQLDKQDTEAITAALHRPMAKLSEGIAMAESGLVTACMDSSDGVGGCLYELATANSVDIIIAGISLRSNRTVERVAKSAMIDPRKLMLAWGSWELVCTIRPDALSTLQKLMLPFGTTISAIGEVQHGTGKVWFEENEQTRELTNFASERFSATSMFTYGLDAYMEWFLSEPLTT
ncbi:MAG: thiamine-phosphate kinase [Armatimonadota bacterium]|nr:thiamine-phosphate kinase [bacterium]